MLRARFHTRFERNPRQERRVGIKHTRTSATWLLNGREFSDLCSMMSFVNIHSKGTSIPSRYYLNSLTSPHLYRAKAMHLPVRFPCAHLRANPSSLFACCTAAARSDKACRKTTHTFPFSCVALYVCAPVSVCLVCVCVCWLVWEPVGGDIWRWQCSRRHYVRRRPATHAWYSVQFPYVRAHRFGIH